MTNEERTQVMEMALLKGRSRMVAPRNHAGKGPREVQEVWRARPWCVARRKGQVERVLEPALAST